VPAAPRPFTFTSPLLPNVKIIALGLLSATGAPAVTPPAPGAPAPVPQAVPPAPVPPAPVPLAPVPPAPGAPAPGPPAPATPGAFAFDATSGQQLVDVIKKLQEPFLKSGKPVNLRPVYATPEVVNAAYAIWKKDPSKVVCKDEVVDAVFSNNGCMETLKPNRPNISVEIVKRSEPPCIYTSVRCVTVASTTTTEAALEQAIAAEKKNAKDNAFAVPKRIFARKAVVAAVFKKLMVGKPATDACAAKPNDPDTELGALFANFGTDLAPLKVECI